MHHRSRLTYKVRLLRPERLVSAGRNIPSRFDGGRQSRGRITRADWWTSILDSLVSAKTGAMPSPAPIAAATLGHPIFGNFDQEQPAPAQQPAAAPAPSWGNTLGAIPTGLYEGLAKAGNLPTNAINAVTGVLTGLTGQDYGQMKPPLEENPTGYQPVGGWATGLHEGASALSNTAALGAGARMLAPLLPAGSAPAITANAIGNTPPSVLAASAAGGAAEEPIARNVPEEFQPVARLATSLAVGGPLSGLEAATGNVARSAIEPGTAQLAQMARDTYNIPIRAGQITGNRILRTADSVLKSVPLSGHGAVDDDAIAAWITAVSHEMGENSPVITPQVMNAARTRIGNTLDDIGARTTLQLDQPALDRLTDISTRAAQPESGLDERQIAQVRAHVDKILDIAGTNDGAIPGPVYQNLTKQGETLHSLQNSQSPVSANFGNEIRSTLDGMLDRSVSPEDAAALRQARSQWKVMKTIEPLTLRADAVGGVTPSTGGISPAGLRAAVNKSYPRAAYAEPGQLPLNDLANIGQRFLKEQASSQTSERGLVQKILHGSGHALLGGGVVAGAEHAAPHLLLPAAGAAAVTAGIGRLAGAGLREWLANRMIDSGVSPQVPQSAMDAAWGSLAPIAASSGTRQLDAPAPTSVNPATGLPQFNLADNEAENRKTKAEEIAAKLADGSLADDAATKAWVGENKRDLRRVFGGQGIQNIILVSSLIRRATGDKTQPSTLLSSLLSGEPPPSLTNELQQQDVNSPKDVIALAILSPSFARAMATKNSRADLTKTGQARVINAVKAAREELNGVNDSGNSVPVRGRMGGRPGMGSGAAPKTPKLSEAHP